MWLFFFLLGEIVRGKFSCSGIQRCIKNKCALVIFIGEDVSYASEIFFSRDGLPCSFVFYWLMEDGSDP